MRKLVPNYTHKDIPSVVPNNVTFYSAGLHIVLPLQKFIVRLL